AGVGQVERVRMPLAAVAEDCDLPREESYVARLDHFDHVVLSLADRRGAPRLGGAGAAQADPSGACKLAHAVRADELLEGVEFLGAADDLKGEGVAADVGNARA